MVDKTAGASAQIKASSTRRTLVVRRICLSVSFLKQRELLIVLNITHGVHIFLMSCVTEGGYAEACLHITAVVICPCFS